jgi:hypothetical protein
MENKDGSLTTLEWNVVIVGIMSVLASIPFCVSASRHFKKNKCRRRWDCTPRNVCEKIIESYQWNIMTNDFKDPRFMIYEMWKFWEVIGRRVEYHPLYHRLYEGGLFDTIEEIINPNRRWVLSWQTQNKLDLMSELRPVGCGCSICLRGITTRDLNKLRQGDTTSMEISLLLVSHYESYIKREIEITMPCGLWVQFVALRTNTVEAAAIIIGIIFGITAASESLSGLFVDL